MALTSPAHLWTAQTTWTLRALALQRDCWVLALLHVSFVALGNLLNPFETVSSSGNRGYITYRVTVKIK